MKIEELIEYARGVDAQGYPDGSLDAVLVLPRLIAALEVGHVLLCEVHQQAGDGAPDSRRHALTPELRGKIRDIVCAGTRTQDE